MNELHQQLSRVLGRKKRHVRFESGFHCDEQLDLDSMFVHPKKLDPFINKLASEIATLSPDAVCGPLSGGAFLAEMVARQLGIEFFYTRRTHAAEETGLYTATYQLPKNQKSAVSGKRVVIIDDVVSAGSATKGTYNELVSCSATPIGVAALLAQGQSVPSFCKEKSLALFAIDTEEINMWPPENCPLCMAGDKAESNDE